MVPERNVDVKKNLLQNLLEKTNGALKIVSSKWIIRWMQYTNYKKNVS